MIQKVEINRQLDEFYCPLTGLQILFEDDFEPSPALMFGYFDDYKSFVFINDKIKEDYKELVNISDGSCKQLDYQNIIDDLNKEAKNYLLVSIGDKFGCVDYCFDLSYTNNN